MEESRRPIDAVEYEFPLNNRVRIFLRYEYLIALLNKTLAKPGNELQSIITLHQLLELTKCNDIKSNLIQHMKWQRQELQLYEKGEQVDQQKLESVLNLHQQLIDEMDEFEMPVSFYQNHHFLNLLKLRLNIPAGTCGFDVPQLQAWLSLSPNERQQAVIRWKQPFDAIDRALTTCMRVMRQSKRPETRVAEEGFYSHKLDSGASHSLLRISISSRDAIYPEVSGGKNRFTMYFFSTSPLEKKPEQIRRNVPFAMVLCSL